MLEEWGLVKILPKEKERIDKEPLQHVRIKVIHFKEKRLDTRAKIPYWRP